MARVKPLIAVAVVAAAVAFGAPAHAVALKWVHRCAYIRAPGFGRLGIYPDRVTCAEGAFITYRTFIEPGTPTPCCSASHYRDGWWCGGHMGAYFCYYPYDRKPTTRAVYAWQCRTTGCPPRILAVRLPAKTLARRNRARPPNTMRATPARAGTAAPSRLKPVQRCAYIRVPVFGRLGIYPDEVTCPEAAFLIYRAFTDRGAPTPCCTGSHWPDGWWCGAGHAASYLCYHPYSRNPYTHAPTTGAVYA